jgi:putative peptide maturation dehydrogenase
MEVATFASSNDYAMQVRRCFSMLIESRERLEFDASLLGTNHVGLRRIFETVALTAHCEESIAVSGNEAAAILNISPHQWQDFNELCAAHPQGVIQSLLDKNLLVSDATSGNDVARRDQTLRAMHWRPLDAVMHRFSRWSGVDTVDAQRQLGESTDKTLLEHLGPAPPQINEYTSAEKRLALNPPGTSPLDDLLGHRVTCRNYDTTRSLSASDFSAVLYRTFGARAVDEYAPDVFLLKRGSPSAGGLHPTEAYVLIQCVEGFSPGLYHYHPADHALEPLREMAADELAALALRSLGGQPYFAEAHAMIAMTSRFARNFWKYRNHAKAYRAVILDIGHLSQTLYLAATELGLGAFITAGINEVDLEQAFDLDAMVEGPLAMCGFGIRGAERREVEFDPLHAVWPADPKTA